MMMRIESDGVYKIVTISDIHFGVTDIDYMYNTLQEQFINRLEKIEFNILAICGDLFDSKFMSNNPVISYTLQFMDNLVHLCAMKMATLVLLDGTTSHDNGQLSLFYYYLKDPTVDVRIVENIQFEDIKGLRVLCIPERYNIPEEFYKEILFNSGVYDLCFMHGTFRGSFKGSEIATLNSNYAPVFSMNSFSNCNGPILMGHYHIPGCYEEYAYYNGSALRFRFGEEQEKGFLITLYNKYTRRHYTELVPIKSHTYVTIGIDDLVNNDPKDIIEYIKNQKEINNIDYIRVQYNNSTNSMEIVRNYFRNNKCVTLQELDKKSKQLEQIDQAIIEQNSQYSYIIDNSIDDYTKFCMYINQNEGCEFITVEDLLSLLEEKV